MKHLRIISKWVLPSVKAACKLLAVSAEVFCRHSFGPRYSPALVAGFLFCLVIMTVLSFLSPSQSSSLIIMYLFCYFVLLVYHLISMWRPRANTHSRSSGQSWGFWGRINLPPTLVKILLEPAILIFVGVVSHPVNGLLSGWLFIAGICLAIKELISFWKHWHRVLDSADARVEGERVSTGVRQYTAPSSGREQRVSPVAAVEQAQPEANSIRQIYSRLDPALQQLIAAPTQNRPNRPVPNRPANRAVVPRIQVRPGGRRTNG